MAAETMQEGLGRAWKMMAQRGWKAGLRRVAGPARIAAAVATAVLLGVQAKSIGWHRAIEALPDSGWFYLCFCMSYALLPLVDTYVHARLWRLNLWPHAIAFAVKKVYNFALFGYAGEIYILAYARGRLGLSLERAFAVIKDNGILSGAASTALTIVLVIAAAVTWGTQLWRGAAPHVVQSLIAGVMAGAIVLGAILVLRRSLFALPPRELGLLLVIHTARNVAALVLQVLVWWLCAPAVPLGIWIVYLAGYLVLTRMPFLPNRDAVFMALGMGISGLGGAHAPDIATVMLVTGALTQLAHGLVFVAAAVLHLGRVSDLAPPREGGAQ